MPVGASRSGNLSVAGVAIPDSVVSRGNDDDSTAKDGVSGLEIETQSEWPSIGRFAPWDWV